MCTRLDSLGDEFSEEEKLVILVCSSPPEYDAIVQIIEAREHVDSYETKEMSQRECDTMIKREIDSLRLKLLLRGDSHEDAGMLRVRIATTTSTKRTVVKCVKKYKWTNIHAGSLIVAMNVMKRFTIVTSVRRGKVRRNRCLFGCK